MEVWILECRLMRISQATRQSWIDWIIFCLAFSEQENLLSLYIIAKFMISSHKDGNVWRLCRMTYRQVSGRTLSIIIFCALMIASGMPFVSRKTIRTIFLRREIVRRVEIHRIVESRPTDQTNKLHPMNMFILLSTVIWYNACHLSNRLRSMDNERFQTKCWCWCVEAIVAIWEMKL